MTECTRRRRQYIINLIMRTDHCYDAESRVISAGECPGRERPASTEQGDQENSYALHLVTLSETVAGYTLSRPGGGTRLREHLQIDGSPHDHPARPSMVRVLNCQLLGWPFAGCILAYLVQSH